MQIYLAHPTCYNYYDELYGLLQELGLPIIFPHLTNQQAVNSKELIAQSELLIAEVSYPSTGAGIELG